MRRRPSMFSSSYREQVRRRRINITLIVLILVSAAYFGGQYYINKYNIKVFENFKLSSLLQFNKKASETKGASEGKKPAETPAKPEGGQQTQTPPKEEKKTVFYDYAASGGKVLRVEVEVTGESKIIKGLAQNNEKYAFDISADKQMIVFEDRGAQNIITCDVNGKFNNIGPKEYTSKSSGEVIDKAYTMKNRTWHIWSQKPHFTRDGRVAYLSNLPYVKLDGDLYLWTVNLDGTGNRKIGIISGNIGNISYSDFTDDGKLVIKSADVTYYLGQNSYALGK